ncbi:hypothetical protein [Tenacibaculum agarivorans]|uniref:hypothetical protein n=1 Tax=Tenacibaculum agarivorans TaxID=1908389 RepID=UPI00094BB0C2|nr:hypothetical protein [Tenacibaculum agarivorans]
MNFKIQANKPLSLLVNDNGLFFWKDVVNHVKKLPYGRNSNRYDLGLVIQEEKGSCSSKHAFLAEIAKENSITSIELILGIYKMNSDNTAIGDTLINAGVAYIPEAHCYLKINGTRLDITSENTAFDTIKKDILLEKVIVPNQVSEFKVIFHKQFIKDWIKKEKSNMSFADIWTLREKCITYLSQN